MRAIRFLIFSLIVFELFFVIAQAQNEPAFELPVQLIGFPVIIMAVRLSNFVKKLVYAVNPKTYQKRSRRSLGEMDVIQVEKRLISELGERVCIYENVCRDYADRANSLDGENKVLDWENVFTKYEDAPKDNKKFYLLSVFLGDIVASPELCRQLAKRGRSCK